MFKVFPPSLSLKGKKLKLCWEMLIPRLEQTLGPCAHIWHLNYIPFPWQRHVFLELRVDSEHVTDSVERSSFYMKRNVNNLLSLGCYALVLHSIFNNRSLNHINMSRVSQACVPRRSYLKTFSMKTRNHSHTSTKLHVLMHKYSASGTTSGSKHAVMDNPAGGRPS